MLSLVSAGEVSGVVLSTTGEPLSEVAVYVLDERLAYATSITTEDGFYSFTGLPDGRYRVWANPGGDINAVSRAWPGEWDFCRGTLLEIGEDSVRADLDFDLANGGTLTGLVQDASGEAVVGATVLAEGLSARVSGLSREATTDFEGGFTIVGLDGEPDVEEAWVLRVAAEGWPDQYMGSSYEEEDATEVGVEIGEGTGVEPMSLLDGILVEGTVTGPDGPLQGVEVFVYSSGQITDALTDEAGAYRAMGLPPGDVLLWGNLEGYALTYLGGEASPGGTEPVDGEGEVATGVDLEMPRESRLVGSLVNEQEEDLSGVTLLAYHESMRAGLGDVVQADGTFAVGRLHGDGYHLYIYAGDEGYVDDFVRDDQGAPVLFSLESQVDTEPVEVSLPLGASISGRVYAEGLAGTAVYGASVSAFPSDANQRVRSASVDRSGDYEISGLVPGTYNLQVRFSPVCASDGGYVWQWWSEALVEEAAESLDLAAGEHLGEMDFKLAVDDDLDGMSDDWEREHGLDPNRDDSQEDPDGDGVSNLDEFLWGTDPVSKEGGCGCTGTPSIPGLWWVCLAPVLVVSRRRGVGPGL